MAYQYDEGTQAGACSEIDSVSRTRADTLSSLLASVSVALTGKLDERLRMERLARCLTEALAEWCLIELVDPDGQLQNVALAAKTPELAAELREFRERHPSSWGQPGSPRQDTAAQAVVLLEEAHWAEPVSAVEALVYESLLQAFGSQSVIVAPISLRGQPAGAIILQATASGHSAELLRAWIAEIAGRAAVAIENARLFANERAARAEAEAAIRERDELTALLAHDLRNPLAVVHGQTEQLLRQLRQPELERERLTRGLEAVRSAATQMRFLLEDLHDLVHVRVGHPLRLEPEPVELVALTRRVAAVQQATSSRHELRVEATSPVLWCVCDVRRLERVLTNLLGNAIKFSPGGGPITLMVGQTADSDGEWATLSVADKGVGITQDDLPEIFAPFHRGQNVVDTIRGTGLGLASVREIIVRHGGTISVDSKEGEGSTFTIQLPLKEDEL